MHKGRSLKSRTPLGRTPLLLALLCSLACMSCRQTFQIDLTVRGLAADHTAATIHRSVTDPASFNQLVADDITLSPPYSDPRNIGLLFWHGTRGRLDLTVEATGDQPCKTRRGKASLQIDDDKYEQVEIQLQPTCPANPTCTTAFCWESSIGNDGDFHAVTGRGQEAWAVSGAGVVRHWNGTDWNKSSTVSDRMNPNSTPRLFGIWASSTTIYVVGNFNGGGQIHKMSESGSIQLCPDMKIDQPLNGIWGKNDDEIYAVGKGGELVSLERGNCKNETITITSEDLYDIIGLPDGSRWAIGGKSLFKQAGMMWQPEMTAAEPYDWGRFWTNGTDALVMTGSTSANRLARVLRWNNGGWISVGKKPGSQFEFLGVWGRGDKAWFVGQGGNMARFHLSAFKWEDDIITRTSKDLWGIWGPADGPVFAVGMSGTILRYQP